MKRISVFSILLIIPVMLFTIFWAARPVASALAEQGTQDAGTPWYHPAWHYRQLVTITNSGASTLTNYQVLVKLDNTNFDFSQANANGSDLRVTDSGGVTPLPFWIESWASPLAYVWIKVPSIPASSTATVYLYFGNTTAASASRGDLTFDFFDDNWCQFPGSTGCGPTNPVLSAGQNWWETGAGFPVVFEDTSFPSRPRYHMLYSGYDVIGPAKGYAWSSDLNTWTEYNAGTPHPPNPNPVIGLDPTPGPPDYPGNATYTYGDTIKVGSTYYMFPFRNNSTAQRAESTDLLTWTDFTDLTISSGTINSAIGILKGGDGITPIVVGGEYWMVYAQDSGTGSLYLAHSSDLENWTTSGAIIAPTPGGWDTSGLWTPSFARLGDKYYIYYQGNGSLGWVIGFAKADAYSGIVPIPPPSTLSSWTKSDTDNNGTPDPVIKRGASGWDSGQAVHPNIRQFSNGVYYVFYAGYSTKYAIGYAYASAPDGPWTKLGGTNTQWSVVSGSPTVSSGVLNLIFTAPSTRTGIRTAMITFLYKAIGYRALIPGGGLNTWGGFITGSGGDRTMIGTTASSSTNPYLRNCSPCSAESLSILPIASLGSFHEYELLWRPGMSVAFVDHGAATTSLSVQVPSAALPVTFYNYTNPTTMQVDWFYVRNYSNPEPTATINTAESCMPATVYVDDGYAPGTVGTHIWNCDAFSSVQTALDTANTANSISVADGTYAESVSLNRAVTVSMSGNITLNGNLSIHAGTLNAPAGTLSISGNFTRSGGTFDHGNGMVTFTGAGTHNLDLSSATTFYNLTVDTGVILIETVSADNATVAGTLTNNGTIRKTQSVASTGSRTFGLAGVTIHVMDRTGGDPLTGLLVDRIDQNHPYGTGSGGWGTNTGRYWVITPTGSDYTVNLILQHNLVDHTLASVCRYDGLGAPGDHWNCDRSSSTANTVTRTDITELSDWAVGNNVGPTAVKLIGLTATSARGKVLQATVAASLVTVLVVAVLLWRRRVRTQQ